jgi:predicted Fe-Mo cluster-binding NifX family protein
MKIGVAYDGNIVAQHFGHCEGFNVAVVENGEVKESEKVPNPGHRPGFLPNFLNDLGIKVIIAGGMGGGAVQIFNEHNIDIITGASGNIDDVLATFAAGNLKSTGSVCNEHQHHDECGE